MSGEYTDISSEIISSADVNISTVRAFVENGIVSIYMNVTFTKTDAVTFANISEKYAPREDTLGIFYGSNAVMINNEITHAKVYKDGRIYCYIDKMPNMIVDFQFTYPLKTS